MDNVIHSDLGPEGRIDLYTSQGVSHVDVSPFESIRQWLPLDESPDELHDDPTVAYWDAFEDASMDAYEQVQAAIHDAESELG